MAIKSILDRICRAPDDGGAGAGAGAAGAGAAGTGGAGAAPAAFDWKGAGVTDDTMVGYVQNKGWKNPADLLTSYTNLEKLHGAPERLVQLPKDDSDAAAWGQVYDKLGRPKDAKGYDLGKLVPQGQDTKFAEAASTWFHEAGLTPKQATALVTKWNEHVASVTTQQTEATRAEHAAQITALKSEWGANFEAHAALVDRAAVTFGIDAKKLDALKAAMGPGEAMKSRSRPGTASPGTGWPSVLIIRSLASMLSIRQHPRGCDRA